MNQVFWPTNQGTCCLPRATTAGFPVTYDDYEQVVAPWIKHNSRAARWVLLSYRALMAVFFVGMIPVLHIYGEMEYTKDDLMWFTNWGYYSAIFYFWAQTVYGLWFMYNTRHEASENEDELRTSQRTADMEFYFSGPCAFWKFICFALMWSQTC